MPTTSETTAQPARPHQLEWPTGCWCHARTGLAAPCLGCAASAGRWGTCCMLLAGKRRRIARTNWALCFPDANRGRAPTGPCASTSWRLRSPGWTAAGSGVPSEALCALAHQADRRSGCLVRRRRRGHFCARILSDWMPAVQHFLWRFRAVSSACMPVSATWPSTNGCARGG